MKVLICILVFLCTLCSCVFFRGLVNSLTVTFHHLASKSQNLRGFSNSFLSSFVYQIPRKDHIQPNDLSKSATKKTTDSIPVSAKKAVLSSHKSNH